MRRLSALMLAVSACGGPPLELSTTAYEPAPLVPAILRDVAMIEDDDAFTAPYVPGHRTTMDGRVAIRVQGGTRAVARLATNLSFFLFVPERLDEPILTGPAGPQILADTEPFDVTFPPALDPEVFRLGHHALCDPTEPFAVDGERPNPYACGPDSDHDCYDLTIVSSTSPGLGAQIWGTPATVEVASPKTRDARIVDVTLGEPVQGASISLTTEWTEPAITQDGRLMTGRLGRFPRDWTNPNTGDTLNRPYDLAYSVLPPEAEPCDVTGWTAFHPMSHAPYDPDMVGRYGLAAYPFRDTEGQPIPDGEDMGGTYPWVDREGANLFMTGVPGRISEQSTTRYPRRCVHEGCEAYLENVDFDRGFMVAGLWTHGKLVHLDGAINNIDWAVGVHPQAHWWVDLYRDEAGEAVPVRFGSGRFIEHFRETNAAYPPGYTHNANVLDSLQNVLNALPHARTITPRDVVWVMSTGVATAEVAFDDLLDPHALIVSNMQASITQLYDDEGRSTAIPLHHNGQVRTFNGIPGVAGTFTLAPDLDDDIHLQNGATSLDWAVPAYGLIEAGEARIEPVALGGTEGRGLWLSGDAAVTYDMPAQPGVDEVDAYVGVFVDPRAPGDGPRSLLTFPDGSRIAMDHESVHYVRDDRVVHTIAIPAVDGWVHLGWQIAAGHREVTFLHEGMALDRHRAAKPLFSLDDGALTVGRRGPAHSGVRGWIDDLVVLAHDVDPEVACNHARGTLVAVGDNARWTEVAARHPGWAHEAVAEAAVSTETAFACAVDHTDDLAINLAHLPAGTTSVRDAILFPEGPLHVGVPRPDSADNAFCLSCHTAEGKGGLSLAALAPDAGTLTEHDRRRQPHQPPRRVFGHIPAGWLGDGKPAEAMVAPPEGLLIDAWVLSAGE